MLAGLRPAQRGEVRRWWAGLADADRRQVSALSDERCEACFFSGSAAGPVPRVLGGRFLPHDDAWRYYEWEEDWREYLGEHPDVFLLSQCQSRSFRNGDGILNVVVDWRLTRFRGEELPPSERRHAEPGAALDPGADSGS
jgi:hypothetical protein